MTTKVATSTSFHYTLYVHPISYVIVLVQKAKGIIALQHTLHNITAAQLLEQLGETLPHHLLDLIIIVVVLLVLVLPTTVLLLLATMLLSVMLTTMLLTAMLLAAVLARISAAAILWVLRRGRHAAHRAALEVYVNAALVLLSLVLQPQLTADLLDSGLDFLHVITAMVALAHDDVKVVLAAAFGSLDPLLEHVLSLLNKQAVQIDGVVLDTAVRVVLAEDVVARLAVVLVHLGGVLLAFCR